MSESVSLPALGESVTEGTVTRWLKNVGDRVEVDEPLLEVSTDKVDTEIPSPVAGVIEEILVQEDETVDVGTALVRIGDGAASSGGSDEAPESAEQAPEAGEPESTGSAEAESEGSAAREEPAEQQEEPAKQQEEPAKQQEEPAKQQEEPAKQQEEPAEQQEEPPAEVPSREATDESQAPAPAEPEPAPAQHEDAPAPAQQQEPSAPEPQPAAAPQPAEQPETAQTSSASEQSDADADGAGYITPLVRKLAHERGVDLGSVRGTGVGGRIRKQDVLDAASSAKSSGEGGDAQAARSRPEVSPLRGTTVPMSRLRKVVAERAVASMQSTAQLTSVVEVDITRVAALRDKRKADFHEKTGVKLSFLPFFAVAATEALQAYPVINASVDGETIVYPDHENISFAVDTERGLLTPVVKNAGGMSIKQFAEQIADLAARTRDNKLKPDELAGGTFTLTNTGSRGALFDTPVVFLPQVAILGTGIVTRRPAVVTVDGAEAIGIRSFVYLALSYDHRIVDGADAARFLVAVKNRLEEGDFESDLGI